MRILTHIKQAGTKSFRLATSKLFEYGVNAQNTDKDILDMLVAPDGYCIVQADQAGAEALIVAYLASAGKYRDLFLHGVKPHVYVALHLFLDKFRGAQPRDRYWLRPPQELKALPEWKALAATISASPFEYDIGKRTGHACCDEATEVLTPNGWVPISTMPDTILTCNKDGGAVFDTVVWNKYSYEGALHHFVGEEVDQMVTGNHRMVYKTNSNLKIKTAVELAASLQGTRNLPTTVAKSGISIDHTLIRLAAAVQADGSFTGQSVRFHFRKLRKVERLEELCLKIGLTIDWKISADGDYTTSIRRDGLFGQACELLTPDKRFSWNLVRYNVDVLDALCDEVCYWDGHIDDGPRNYRSYMSSIKENVDIINTCARLCNIGSTVRENAGLWTVSFNRRSFCLAKHVTQVSYTGYVYCPTTRLGCFLIRRAGKISYTANSNYEMGPHTFQESTLKESEGTLVLEYTQSKFFLDTYKQLFPEIVAWQQEIKERVRRDRVLHNLFGYPRRFEQILTDGYLRDAISWIPQSTVGCITHHAYNNLTDHIIEHKLPWRLFNNKHDSYAALVPVDHAREAADRMTQFLAITLTGWDGSPFTMRSEVQVGFNMGKAKLNKKTGVWTNPRGLKEPEWT